MGPEPHARTRSSAERPLRDRILLRFPSLVDLAALALFRLPPGGLLRRRLVERAFQVVWAGINRGDFEPALLAYEPDAEVRIFGASGVGLAGSYSGSDGWIEFIGDIFENFGAPRFSVRRVRDGGGRIVAELGLTATGKVSGAEVEESTSSVYYFSSRGKVARQEIFWQQDSWAMALEAADLSEQ